MFDFEVKHVFRSRHTAINELSRQSKIEKEKNNTEDFNEFIDSELNVVKILVLKAEKKINILKSEYSHESQQITLEARHYYKPGQSMVDPNTNQLTVNQFESSSRIEAVRVAAVAK